MGQLDVPANLSNVVAIAAGSSHSLALKSDGTVVSWGTWGTDQLRVPDGLANVVAIGAGGGSVALKADGTLAVWGRWGISTTNIPPELTNVVAVAGSYFGWLALRADGTVFDAFGQGIAALSGHSNIVAIAGSYGTDGHENLALKADGTVVGWGFTYFTGPVPNGLSNVVAIAAGGSHNLVLVGAGPPALRARAMNPTVSKSGFCLNVDTRSGRVYRLEYKTLVDDTEWKGLPLVAGTGGTLTFVDPGFDGSSRFYRVRQW